MSANSKAIPADPTAYDWDRDNYYRKAHWRLRLVGALVSRYTPSTALDIGCGDAGLRRLLPPATQYFGCDSFVDGNSTTSQTVVNWKYAGGDLPFGDIEFDAIVCSGFIEYVDDHRALFGLVASRLSDSGVFIVSSMNPNGLRILLHRHRLPLGYRHPAWRNIAEWSALVSALDQSGLRIEAFVPVASMPLNQRNLQAVVARSLALGPPRGDPFRSMWIPQGILVARKTKACASGIPNT